MLSARSTCSASARFASFIARCRRRSIGGALSRFAWPMPSSARGVLPLPLLPSTIVVGAIVDLKMAVTQKDAHIHEAQVLHDHTYVHKLYVATPCGAKALPRASSSRCQRLQVVWAKPPFSPPRCAFAGRGRSSPHASTAIRGLRAFKQRRCNPPFLCSAPVTSAISAAPPFLSADQWRRLPPASDAQSAY